MLTKDDLQAIRGIVKEEVRSEVSAQMDDKLKPIRQEMRKMNKKLDLVITSFDSQIIDHEVRISCMEKTSSHSSVN